jgi:hypothetical protein
VRVNLASELVLPCSLADAEAVVDRSAAAIGRWRRVDDETGALTTSVGRVFPYAILTATVTSTGAAGSRVTIDASGSARPGWRTRRALRQMLDAVRHVDERWYPTRRRAAELIFVATLVAVACVAILGAVVLIVAATSDGSNISPP